MAIKLFKMAALVCCGLLAGATWAQGVNLAVPQKVDNGAAVHVTATFNPPLRAGERAVLSVNGTETLQAVIRQGELAELGLRILLARTQNEVQVSRYAGANRSEEQVHRVETTLPGTPGTPSSLSVAEARARFTPDGGGILRILLRGENGYAGVLSVNDSNFGLDLTSRGGLSSNPFFMIRGSLTQGASLSAQAFAPTAPAAAPASADDPKARGRSARMQ